MSAKSALNSLMNKLAMPKSVRPNWISPTEAERKTKTQRVCTTSQASADDITSQPGESHVLSKELSPPGAINGRPEAWLEPEYPGHLAEDPGGAHSR